MKIRHEVRAAWRRKRTQEKSLPIVGIPARLVRHPNRSEVLK